MTTLKRINYLFVIKIIGALLLVESFAMLLSLPFSIYYGSKKMTFDTLFNGKDDLLAIVLSALIVLVVGLLLLFGSKKSKNKHFDKHEGFLLVTLSWIFLSLFGTLPYLLSGVIPKFTHAFFETASGFTTTGLSVISDVESVPKGILIWRSITHWIGGMGIMMMYLALFPMIGVKGGMLYSAEASGDIHEKLHPRIKETVKKLWYIYFGITLLCFILLKIGGLNLVDSVCYTFSTISTGGFCTKNTSLKYASKYVHYVVIFFMIISATNFNVHYLFLKRKWKKAFQNEELKVYWGIILASTLLIFVVLLFGGHLRDIEYNFRTSLFHVVSVLTTTGFFISDFTLWDNNIWIVLFVISFICGCSGSTTGGVKVWRHIVLFKNYKMELKRQLHPQAVIPVRYNKHALHPNAVYNVTAFFYFFLAIFFVSSIILSLFGGLDFLTSMGTTISCFANIGVGVGDIASPSGSVAGVSNFVVWYLSFLMIVGRLEVFTVFIIFNKAFWKR